MALKLSLKPGEKFVVNGAVIVNGDRRSSLIIQNRVSILRERDILLEADVNSPVKRVYFPIMMMHLDEEDRDDYYQEFVLRMTELFSVFTSPETVELCVKISQNVMEQEYYKALMQARKLLKIEEAHLTPVAAE